MSDMVTLGCKDTILEPGNRISTLMSNTLHFWTWKSIGNIFLPYVVYMFDMVTLGSKDNVLESGNRISTLMPSVLDLWTLKSIGNIVLPWVVHMCDIVTLGGRGNVLEPRNYCVYGRTDNPHPHNFVAGGIKQVSGNRCKYVIKRISHSLWCDMIFIQRVVRCLSPRQGSEIENAQLVG
jgi:hypothetical protein